MRSELVHQKIAQLEHIPPRHLHFACMLTDVRLSFFPHAFPVASPTSVVPSPARFGFIRLICSAMARRPRIANAGRASVYLALRSARGREQGGTHGSEPCGNVGKQTNLDPFRLLLCCCRLSIHPRCVVEHAAMCVCVSAHAWLHWLEL